MQGRIKQWLLFILICLVLYATWLMIRLSLPYTSFDRYTDFLMTKQLVYHIRYWRLSFYVHVFVSSAVLVTGLLQCSRYLLQKYPRLHRSSGKIYVAIILCLSGPSGLVMSFYANGGWPARVSFVLLSLLWIGSTFMGWRYALQQRWRQHGHMMLRSYALTLSALTLRFYAYLIGACNIPLRPRTAYITIAWLSWTLNLLIMEWWVYQRNNRHLPQA